MDFLAEPSGEELILGTSNPGRIQHSWGGVGRNLAHATATAIPYIQRQEMPIPAVALLSVMGDDPVGQSFYLEHQYLETHGVHQLQGSSGVYFAIAEGSKQKNDLHAAVVQVDILERLTPELISRSKEQIQAAKIVVADANLSSESIEYLIQLCKEAHIPFWFEPTSVPKSIRMLELFIPQAVAEDIIISPNRHELEWMAGWVRTHHPRLQDTSQFLLPSLLDQDDTFTVEKEEALILLGLGIRNVVTTLGPQGTLLATRGEGPMSSDSVHFYHFEAPPAEVIQVNGAGDAMAGCCVAALTDGRTLKESIELGHLCAKLILEGNSLHDLPSLL